VELRFFLKACGLLVFELVLIVICLFFGLVFGRILFCGLLFLTFTALLLFRCTAKGILGVFLENLLILGLFFRICLPDFLFNFLADFSFC